MENIVNLEQLDYRDQLIKDYIDEHSGGGSGSSLFCELEVVTDYDADWYDQGERGKLYIKCYKGELLDTDEIQFARNIATPTYWATKETVDPDTGIQKTVKILKKKRKGWIIPRHYSYVDLYKVYDEEKSERSDKYDYWEVKVKDRDGEPVTWTDMIDLFLRHRHNELDSTQWYKDDVFVYGQYNYNYASFINQWCGLAIKRDGKLITTYKRWRVTGPNKRNDSSKEHKHFISCFSEMGTYYEGLGPDETDSGFEEFKYLYGFEI